MKKTAYRLVPLLAIVAFLAATVTPCPIQPAALGAGGYAIGQGEPHRGHRIDRAHHHEDSEMTPAQVQSDSSQGQEEVAFLTAPCPCGCGQRSGSSVAAKRLGPILLSEPEAMLVLELPPAETAMLQPAPEYAPSPPDQIPIPS